MSALSVEILVAGVISNETRRVRLDHTHTHTHMHCGKQEEMIYTYMTKCPPHLINVLTLPSENENITFYTFIMHSLNIRLHAASS